MAGQSFALADSLLGTAPLDDALLLASLSLPSDVLGSRFGPREDIATSWSSESVLLVVNPELREPLAIDGTRLSNSLQARSALLQVAIAPALSGSPVTDAASGKLLDYCH
ncbi:MAG: hypothetical protein R3C56_21720 [Pirellulaceae bacterium]